MTAPAIAPGANPSDAEAVSEDVPEVVAASALQLAAAFSALMGTSSLSDVGFACHNVNVSASWSTIRYDAVRKYLPTVASCCPMPEIKTSRWLSLKTRDPFLSIVTKGTTYWLLGMRMERPESRTMVISPSNLRQCVRRVVLKRNQDAHLLCASVEEVSRPVQSERDSNVFGVSDCLKVAVNVARDFDK